MVDTNKVKALISLVQETGIAELDVQEGESRIRIVQTPAAAPVASAPAPAPPAVEASASAPEATAGAVVAAPLAGTFYRSPAPGEPPFVEVGDAVAVGDVLCIIESMKMMNRVESDKAGQVAAVLLDNGRAIASGTPLFRIV